MSNLVLEMNTQKQQTCIFEYLPLEILDLLSKFVAFRHDQCYEEPVIELRHLTFFSRAYKRVKLTPTYSTVCKMIRCDMCTEVEQSENVSRNRPSHRVYNLSANKDFNWYWIMWARLTSGRTVRIVGELPRFYALSNVLPKAEHNSLIEMFRRHEAEESDADDDEEEDSWDFKFMANYDCDDDYVI